MRFWEHRLYSLCACLLFTLLLGFLPAMAAGKSWVLVTRKAGTVESKLANSQSWLRIPNSRRLGLDDSVRTKESGKAVLTLADNSIIAVNPNTTVVMRKFVLNSRQRHAETHIEQGSLRTQVSKFKGQDNRYQITSPNAVMAAQGTDFSVKVIGEGQNVKTYLRVYSGSVAVTNIRTDETKIVAAGQSAIIFSTDPIRFVHIYDQGQDTNNVQDANISSEDIRVFEEEIDLPQGGDERLRAIPHENRGEISSRQDPMGIESLGSSGENSNPAAPIIPGEPSSSSGSTGSVIIDLTPFTH